MNRVRYGWGSVMVLCLMAPASGQTVKLSVVSSGAAEKSGGYVPQRLVLSPTKPANVTKMPPGLSSARFGVLNLGPVERRRAYAVLLNEPVSGTPGLWIDANGDGDLTNDPPAEWQRNEYSGSGGKTMVTFSGGAVVFVDSGEKPAPIRIAMYRFDPNDPMRAGLKESLMYYADYALEGTLSLDGETYPVMVCDTKATGDFRPPAGVDAGTKAPAVRLLIDRNHDGRFSSVGETFDASKPLNLKGTTYELKLGDAFGAGAQLVKGSKFVPEVPAPPDLRVGKPAVAFEANTTDGAVVRFPQDYKGKLVLLDFWATWCGPCVGEIPGLVKAYERFKGRGLEVLGVSLDKENMAERLAAFASEKGMTWRQVYDGKYWKADIAQRYGIDSIPAPILVDGSTGLIVAKGEQLRGEALAKTIEAQLAKRK